MKKFIVMAAMMISSTALFAQREVGTFTIQPKVGMNIANLTNYDDADARIGLAIGAEVEYQATDMISITAGALYSMQGCKEDGEGATLTTKLDYINIPILANVYVMKNLAVKLGIQPGFNVNSKMEYSKGDDSAEAGLDDVKTLDLSIPVGVSYEYKNFVLDGRYNLGLTKVSGDSDCKNSVFQITLGYKFDL